MAVWKETIAGCEVKINNVDHDPPHCHAYVANRDVKVNLLTLEVMNPPPHQLPSKLRRGIKAKQEELLEAWEAVFIRPPGY